MSTYVSQLILFRQHQKLNFKSKYSILVDKHLGAILLVFHYRLILIFLMILLGNILARVWSIVLWRVYLCYTSWLKRTQLTLGILTCSRISFPYWIKYRDVTLAISILNNIFPLHINIAKPLSQVSQWATQKVIMYIFIYFKMLLMLTDRIIWTINRRDNLRLIRIYIEYAI